MPTTAVTVRASEAVYSTMVHWLYLATSFKGCYRSRTLSIENVRPAVVRSLEEHKTQALTQGTLVARKLLTHEVDIRRTRHPDNKTVRCLCMRALNGDSLQ